MSNVRSLLFNSDPKKIPEVVDVFREDVLEKRNLLLGDDPLKQAAVEYLKSEGIDADKMLADLTTRAESYLDKSSAAFSEIKGRLENAFDIPAIDRLVSDVEKSELVQSLKEFDGLEKVKLLAGDIETFVDETIAAVDVKPMIDMVNNVIGKTSDVLFSFVDVVGQSALVKGLTASLMAWRVPELIEALIDSIEDDEAKAELWQENAVHSAKRGDLVQADRYVQKLAPSRSRLVETELIRGMLANYRREAEETRSLKDAGEALIAFCNRINPQWDRHDDNTVDLRPYLGISEDAAKALSFTDRRLPANAARQVEVLTHTQLMNTIFPQFDKEF